MFTATMTRSRMNNLRDKYTAVGPFESEEGAEDWVKANHIPGEYWETRELRNPKEYRQDPAFYPKEA